MSHAPADPARPGPLDPAVAVALLQRGQTLASLGEWALAAATFGRVVGSRDPDLHVAALLGLAEARYRQDDEQGALQAWITATQAPETALSWRAWQQLAASRVRSGDLAGASRAYREAERRAPPAEREALAARIGWLAKEQGDSTAASKAFSRARGRADAPIVTWAILAVTVAIGVSMFFLGQADLWVDLFALDKSEVADGQYWRLVSVVLVHGSIIHLAFNMYALWAIGPVVEALYGSARFTFIYVVCAAAGSAASFLVSPVDSVGASGAIFGLFGVLLVADRVHKPALTRGARSLTTQIGALIAVNLFIGFAIPGIDNAAHVGGLIAGAWLGALLVPRGATLATFWTRPGGSGGGPAAGMAPVADPAADIGPGAWPSTETAPGPGARGVDLRRMGRLLGVSVLLGAIVVAVAIGPVRLLG